MISSSAGPSAADGDPDREHGVRGGVQACGEGLPEALDGGRAAGGYQVRLQGLVVGCENREQTVYRRFRVQTLPTALLYDDAVQ